LLRKFRRTPRSRRQKGRGGVCGVDLRERGLFCGMRYLRCYRESVKTSHPFSSVRPPPARFIPPPVSTESTIPRRHGDLRPLHLLLPPRPILSRHLVGALPEEKYEPTCRPPLRPLRCRHGHGFGLRCRPRRDEEVLAARISSCSGVICLFAVVLILSFFILKLHDCR
jgi:hypothetical protein